MVFKVCDRDHNPTIVKKLLPDCYNSNGFEQSKTVGYMQSGGYCMPLFRNANHEAR